MILEKLSNKVRERGGDTYTCYMNNKIPRQILMFNLEGQKGKTINH